MTGNRLSDDVGRMLQQMCAEGRIHFTEKRTPRGFILLNISK